MLRKKSRRIKLSTSASLTTLKPSTVCITTNWKILKEMEKPDHLICLLKSLYVGQEATVKTGHGTMGWFKTRKRVCQGCIFLPWQFNLNAEYIMWRSFPGGSVVTNLPANVGVVGSVTSLGRSPGEGNGNPLQSSCSFFLFLLFILIGG